MSVVERDCTAAANLCAYPEFALAALLDDPEDPREVTLYPPDADDQTLATTWLSAGVDDTVPLPAVR